MPTTPTVVSSSASASGLLKRLSQATQGEDIRLLVDLQVPVATVVATASLIDSYRRKVLDLAVEPETSAANCTVVALQASSLALRPGKYEYQVKFVNQAGKVRYSLAYELQIVEPLAEPVSPVLPPQSSGNSLTTGPFAVGQPINALRCVMLNSAGSLVTCSGSDPSSFSRMLGLLVASALPGDQVSPVRSGLVTDSSWAWDTSLPVYVGDLGALTQDLAGLAYIQIAGYPETATSVYMDVEDAIRL